MSEPTAVAAAATATAPATAGAGIVVAGIATGLPADLLLPCFVGALWSLRGAGEGGPWARVVQVFFGTLMAAWFAEPAAAMVAGAVSGVAAIDSSLMRFPMAFALGWGGLSIVLGGLARLAERWLGGGR